MNCNRKDFERLGKLFKKHRTRGAVRLDNGDLDALARDFATLLEENNGNFDRDKFLSACGVKDHATANGNGTPVNGDCASRNCYAA